jgi:prepilin-type N-terminal cleavage/methylation domain-containing protein
MQRDRGPARGFTLIELLVVIAIIAILAFILFPTFAKAKKESHKAVCMSNLEQLYKAIIQYATDYDQALPAMVEPWMWDPAYSGVGGRERLWQYFMHVQLGPYIKDKEICSCPAWKAIEKHPPDAEGARLSPYSWGPNGYSWAVAWGDNGPFYDPSYSGTGKPNRVRWLESLMEPARYILIYCNTPNDHSGFGDMEVGAGVDRTQNLAGIFCHGDGHVELIRFYGGTSWNDMGQANASQWRLWWNGGYPDGEFAFAEDRRYEEGR